MKVRSSTTFANRGGKMLFFHGLSDSTFSPLDTVDYYNRLAGANGGADAVQRWSRLTQPALPADEFELSNGLSTMQTFLQRR